MLVSAMRPGTSTEFTVIRDKKEKTLTVTIGQNDKATAQEAAASNAHKLGVSVRPLTKDEQKKTDTTGLLVERSTGLAAKAGIQPGDIIVSANGDVVNSIKDLQSACEKDQVLLLVQRDGGRIFVPIRFADKNKKEAQK